MRAVATLETGSLDNPRTLVDVDLPEPATPADHDLLVRVEAVSINPLDTKVRRNGYPGVAFDGTPRILGWDAAGIVEATGPGVTLFKAGDRVLHAGAIRRSGSFAQRQLVDERLVGKLPDALAFEDGAALALTGITAWEAIVERLGVGSRIGAGQGRSLLVIGGAGGVGSMAIQLGHLLGLTVIATASRDESAAWCRDLGASAIVDHRQPLIEGLKAAGFRSVDLILNCADTDAYWKAMGEAIAPHGRICSIVANREPLDLKTLMGKSATFGWEAMFTRANLRTADMVEIHHLLTRIAGWVAEGRLRSTRTATLGPISAVSIREAQRRVETNASIGKIVVAGW